jgi:hypothetical protein
MVIDTTGSNPGHTHTGASLSSIDISADTNLAVTAPIVLTDDTLSMTAYLDLLEIAAPATPATNNLRIYNEAIKGFSTLKYYDDGGMKREFMRDSIFVAKNIRGTTIAANRIVYATGSEDQVPTIDLAKADSTATLPAIGVTIEAIANGAYGRVLQVRLLENINTAALAEGDILYVSAATAGVPTTTPPVTPNLTQEIGTVLVSDAAAGAIQIVARGITGDEFGTAQNTFIIGGGGAGTKTLTFNATADASLTWDETKFDLAKPLQIAAALDILGSATADVHLVVQAPASQSANWMQWQSATGPTIRGYIDSVGRLVPDLGIDADSVYVGKGAGNLSHTNAIRNVGIGLEALDALTTGDYNVAIGGYAGTALTEGLQYRSGLQRPINCRRCRLQYRYWQQRNG